MTDSGKSHVLQFWCCHVLPRIQFSPVNIEVHSDSTWPVGVCFFRLLVPSECTENRKSSMFPAGVDADASGHQRGHQQSAGDRGKSLQLRLQPERRALGRCRRGKQDMSSDRAMKKRIPFYGKGAAQRSSEQYWTFITFLK